MTVKICDSHFLEQFSLLVNLDKTEMILPIENSIEECEIENCTAKVTRLIHYKGELKNLSLPARKDIIIQMFKELQLAIESGCVVEFGAHEKYIANMPNLTEYKFLVNKDALINHINQNENHK